MLATSTVADAPGVVVLPDVRGLHPYYEALAEALAEAGVHALAIDLYGRTAGAAHRDETFELEEHRAAATDAGVRADVRAAREELRRRGAAAVYVLGFCFGGRAAFMQGTEPGRRRRDRLLRLAGARGAGRLVARARGARGPLRRAGARALRRRRRQDPRPDIEAFYEALSAAHVLEETVVYDGAPHSFFDRSMDEHAAACDDAWHRVLRFMGVPATA